MEIKAKDEGQWLDLEIILDPADIEYISKDKNEPSKIRAVIKKHPVHGWVCGHLELASVFRESES